MHNAQVNTQILVDSETLAAQYPGKFVGVERFARASEGSKQIARH
jgi:hypothetical protein